MNTKHITLILTAVLFTFTVSQAQEFKIPVQNSSDEKLSLINFMDSLPIEGYNGKEIIITPTSGPSFDAPERASGLNPVYPDGTDNTGIGLEVEKSGKLITVRCLLPLTSRGAYKMKIPNNLAIVAESGCDRGNSISIQNMKNEIELKVCSSISLKDVTGPLVLSSVTGSIDIEYSKVNRDKPVSVNSVSGNIDIRLPAQSPADLELRTVTGNISSDFDFPAEDDDMKQIGGQTFIHALNGGGVKYTIVSATGNINLKKGK
jgi:hypothetical protein